MAEWSCRGLQILYVGSIPARASKLKSEPSVSPSFVKSSQLTAKTGPLSIFSIAAIDTTWAGPALPSHDAPRRLRTTGEKLQ
jgi:hypothetical protein